MPWGGDGAIGPDLPPGGADRLLGRFDAAVKQRRLVKMAKNKREQNAPLSHIYVYATVSTRERIFRLLDSLVTPAIFPYPIKAGVEATAMTEW